MDTSHATAKKQAAEENSQSNRKRDDRGRFTDQPLPDSPPDAAAASGGVTQKPKKGGRQKAQKIADKAHSGLLGWYV